MGCSVLTLTQVTGCGEELVHQQVSRVNTPGQGGRELTCLGGHSMNLSGRGTPLPLSLCTPLHSGLLWLPGPSCILQLSMALACKKLGPPWAGGRGAGLSKAGGQAMFSLREMSVDTAWAPWGGPPWSAQIRFPAASEHCKHGGWTGHLS